MDRKNTFTAIAVLCLLGLLASLITVPAGDSQAWPWQRTTFIVDDGGQAAPTAPSNRLIPLTKRTIANAERITEAFKAGISAAGKVIDRTEVAGEQPEAAKAAISEAVQAAAAPAQIPESADLPIPEANTDTGLSLVMVTSDRCGPCRTMKPILDGIGGRWKVRYVDFDDPQVKQWIDVYNIRAVPYYVAYRGHQSLEVAQGLMSAEELKGWLARLERGESSPQGGRFVRSWAQDSLKAVDREYLQMRLTPGSCGMLGCMAHGGGWITETVAENPEITTPKGHWETRSSGGCPSGGCPAGGSTQQVWVADPDPTGTVPWTQDGGYRGGIFGGRRGRR